MGASPSSERCDSIPPPPHFRRPPTGPRRRRAAAPPPPRAPVPAVAAGPHQVDQATATNAVGDIPAHGEAVALARPLRNQWAPLLPGQPQAVAARLPTP